MLCPFSVPCMRNVEAHVSHAVYVWNLKVRRYNELVLGAIGKWNIMLVNNVLCNVHILYVVPV